MHLGSVSLKNVGFGSELSWVCFVFIVSATKQFCFGEKFHQYFEGSYKKFKDGGFLWTDGHWRHRNLLCPVGLIGHYLVKLCRTLSVHSYVANGGRIMCCIDVLWRRLPVHC